MFHRSRFFQGETIPGTEAKDVTWLRADGEEMTEPDWAEGHAKLLCLLLSGEAGLMHLTARGEQESDDTFLLVMNAAHEEVGQRLPDGGAGIVWQVLIDTAEPAAASRRGAHRGGRHDPPAAALHQASGPAQRGLTRPGRPADNFSGVRR